MSCVEYIDLSESAGKSLKKTVNFEKSNGINLKNKKFSSRPKSLALKCIGLSLIRMQYSDKFNKLSLPQIEAKKQMVLKNDAWSSAWIDDMGETCPYPMRHVLEQKYEKNCQCPFRRSVFCQSTAKMTRVNWIHHMRRGHVRIDYDWKKTIKRNQQSGIGGLFEVFCVLCSKTKKTNPISPNEFIQHMKKTHSHFLPYTDYFQHFQRCFICDDETKSFQLNISHRQMCIVAVHRDPNQAGTENFNNCFKVQRRQSIVSVNFEYESKISFENKLKSFTPFQATTLYQWLSYKKSSSRKSAFMPPKALVNQDSVSSRQNSVAVKPNKSSLSSYLTQNASCSSNKIIEFDRILPGSALLTSLSSDKFFFPLPFPLRNELNVKNAYVEWKRMIKPSLSKVTVANPWYCELCNAMIKNINTAYSHLKMCHSPVTFVDNQCKSCNKRFLTTQGFQSHFKDTKRCPIARKCGICSLSVSVNDIYNHLFVRHKNNFNKVGQLTTCLICRDPITCLKSHLIDIHGISNTFQMQPEIGTINYRNGSFFNCVKCALTFLSELELRNHMILNLHHFECHKCPNLKFYMYWELMSHQSALHKHDFDCEIMSCEMCDKKCNPVRFSRPSEKIYHYRKLHLKNSCVVLTNIDIADAMEI